MNLMQLSFASQDILLEVLLLFAGALDVAQSLVDRVQAIFLKKENSHFKQTLHIWVQPMEVY